MMNRNQLQNLMLRLNEVDIETQSADTVEHSIATAVLAAQGFATSLAGLANELQDASKEYLFSGFGDPGQDELKYIKNLANEFLLLVGRN